MSTLPFDPSKLDAKSKIIYDAMVEARKKRNSPFGGPYSALMNHPELCQKIEALGGYLKFEGHLQRNVYQFIVLAVSQSTKTAFEWVDHVSHAIKAGVPEDVIETLKLKGTNASFPMPYQLAARVLNYTLCWKNVPDDLQQEAIQQFGKLGYVEVVVLSGFYQMFSAINQGFDVPLNPGTASPWADTRINGA